MSPADPKQGSGDSVGGLLNATLGNLIELVIAMTALRAGEYMLVKASIAGAIVANTLFLATIALLVPSSIAEANRATSPWPGPRSLASDPNVAPTVPEDSRGATSFTDSPWASRWRWVGEHEDDCGSNPMRRCARRRGGGLRQCGGGGPAGISSAHRALAGTVFPSAS